MDDTCDVNGCPNETCMGWAPIGEQKGAKFVRITFGDMTTLKTLSISGMLSASSARCADTRGHNRPERAGAPVVGRCLAGAGSVTSARRSGTVSEETCLSERQNP
jgi:hypothetical protein